jgi:hypothetical protein
MHHTVRHHTVSQALADWFPGAGLPPYQSTLEIVTFVCVAAMLVGTLVGGVVLLIVR